MADTVELYTTVAGDMVDNIAFKRFGSSRAHAERILAANPGLAAAGEILPAGVVIRIPVPAVADRKATAQRLWD